jgi:hypothetical protein
MLNPSMNLVVRKNQKTLFVILSRDYCLLVMLILLSFLLSISVTAQVSNYSFSAATNVVYNPLTGATVSEAVADDDAQFNIDLNFTFKYAGQDISQIGIGTNGWIRMGASTNVTDNLAAENSTFGEKDGNLNFVFPLWDDMTGAVVSYKLSGVAPDRVFVVEWKDIRWSGFGDAGAPVQNFQVWLYETSNNIEFHYGEMQDGLSGSASIGMTGVADKDYLSITPGTVALSSNALAKNDIASAADLTNVVYTFAPPPICSGTPGVVDVISSRQYVCNVTGGTVDLSLQSLDSASGLLFQWQQSIDDVTWNDVTAGIGAKLPFFTTEDISDDIYYRCVITCVASGLSVSSNSIEVKFAIQGCYCSSAAHDVFVDTDDIGRVTFASLDNGTSVPIVNNGSADKHYSDFTGLTAIDVAPGTTYPITISQISNTDVLNKGHINVFIDYDQNGIFDSPEENVFYGETYPDLDVIEVIGAIKIPLTAATGVTGMRVIIVTSLGGRPQEEPCDAYGIGETEDYLLNILPIPLCTATPVAGTTISSSSYACDAPGNETTVSLSLQGTSIATQLSYQWQTSPDDITWSNINNANSASYVEKIFSERYFRCIVTCDVSGLSDISIPIKINFSFLGCYCSSSAFNSEGEDIGNVTFSNLNNGTIETVLVNSSAKETYSDFTSIAPAEVIQGETYPASVKQIQSDDGFFPSYINIFIDYNHDGVFDETERFINKPTLNEVENFVADDITVPSNALLGLTRMRVTLEADRDYATSPCGLLGYGETEDYLVNVSAPAPCSDQPHAGTALTSKAFICNAVPGNTVLSLKERSIASGLEFQWQSSNDHNQWIDINNATSETFTTANLTVTTYFRCRIKCTASNLFDYSDYTKVEVSFLGCYCSSSAESNDDQDIGNVNIGPLNNGNATPSNGNANARFMYSDFRSLSPAILKQGVSIPVSITQIEQRPFEVEYFYPSYVNVYIDYDQDGEFDLIDEIVFRGNSTSIENIISGSFVIPVTAKIGITGMRIILEDGASHVQNFLPCGTYTWGETEDYLVEIIAADACSASPAPGETITSSPYVCVTAPVPVNLTLKNSSQSAGLTYQWQESSDGTSWNNVTGGTNDKTIHYTSPAISSTRYYRSKVTCASNSSYSTPVKVMSSFLGCYCASGASSAADDDIGNVKIGELLDNGDVGDFFFNISSDKTYTDFRSLDPVLLKQGNTYPLSVSQIGQADYLFCIVNVYIDYNRNGQFDLPKEQVMKEVTGEFYPPVMSVDFTVPDDAKAGNTLMRVVLEEETTDQPNVDAPCGIYNWGETEDYLVKIDGVEEVIEEPTSIGEASNSAVTVFPNPTHGKVNIQFNNASNENAILTVCDIAGEVVYRENILTGNDHVIDLSKNAAGVYILKIIMNKGSFTQKVILSK